MMSFAVMTGCYTVLQDPPVGRAQHLQSHHGEATELQQLSRLLDWLMQASPAILVRPQAAASSAMAGASRKDGEMMQWICQTVLSRDSASRSALPSIDMLGTRSQFQFHCSLSQLSELRAFLRTLQCHISASAIL